MNPEADHTRSLRPSRPRNFLESLSPKPVAGLTFDRGGTTENDGIRVQWYERGPENPVMTVLYVHGFNISADEFYMQVDELSSLPVRQLLVDLRGHGETGEVEPHMCTIDGAADDVYAVLRDRGVTEPLIVVGHSLGGPVSLSLMRRYGSALNLAGTVQISSAVEPFAEMGMPQILAGGVGTAMKETYKFAPALADALLGLGTRAIAPVLAMGFYFRPVGYAVVKFHAAMMQLTPLETYAGYFDDLVNHSELDAADVLSTIPGYILVGDRDDITPVTQSERLSEIWPRGYLNILPESGHMPPLDAPAAVSAAILRLIRDVWPVENFPL